MINADVIQELKKKTDIIKLFNHYNIQITSKGKNHLALCPFHEDKEASLSINPAKNLWQCFGCNEGGDAISLIQKLEKIPFMAALHKLGEFEGVEIKNSRIQEPGVRSQNKEQEQKQDQELMNKVAAFYHRIFKESVNGKTYLSSRGITGTHIYNEYQIGYVDGSLLKAMGANQGIKEQLTTLGILLENGKERFLNCVVFPLFDEAGNCLSFYGRHTKMVKGGHFYLPGTKQGIFNRAAVVACGRTAGRAENTLIITESIIDALSFIYIGMTNMLPIYGTNGCTSAHLELIKTLKPQQIIIALDGDEAGQKAAIRLEAELKDNLGFSFNCQKVTFPDQQDANEYFRVHDQVDFEGLVRAAVQSCGSTAGREEEQKSVRLWCRGAVRPREYATTSPRPNFTTLLKRYQLKYAEAKNGKLTVTIKAENPVTGRFLLDNFNLYSQRHRDNLINQIAQLFNESGEDVEKEVINLIPLAEEMAQNPEYRSQETGEELVRLSQEEEQEALSFLKAPDLLNQIVKDYEQVGYIGEEINKKIAYLVMTSRKMQNPLSLVIMSNSAAGKSSLQKATLEFCPEAEAKHFTRLTQQSLYYLGENALKHKFLSIEEEEGSSEASYSLKVLLSAKELNVVSTCNDPNTGKKKAEEYKTEGPVAVMVSTTSAGLEAELASRTLIISVDESQHQTSNIQERQRYARTTKGLKIKQLKQKILQCHRNSQYLLDNEILVVNDYAPQLTFPIDRLKYRRGNEHYLDLIDAIAFLKQYQKEVKSNEYIPKYVEVTPDDIGEANEIFTEVMGWSIDELAPPTRQLLKAIVAYFEEHRTLHFTRRAIREKLKWSNTHLHNHLKKLLELEYITTISGSNGTLSQYKLMYEGDGECLDKFIIGLKDPSELKKPC